MNYDGKHFPFSPGLMPHCRADPRCYWYPWSIYWNALPKTQIWGDTNEEKMPGVYKAWPKWLPCSMRKTKPWYVCLLCVSQLGDTSWPLSMVLWTPSYFGTGIMGIRHWSGALGFMSCRLCEFSSNESGCFLSRKCSKNAYLKSLPED